MPGFGDWDPNLHPRGFHGRFIKKFKLAPWLDRVLKASTPRTFQTDSQAGQFNFNAAHAHPRGAFSELEMRRVHTDWDEAADHMRNGDIDPTTKKFMDTMDSRMAPTKEGLILGRTFTPEALGLTPQQLNENDPNGIIRMTGNTITDKAYSPTHLGSDLQHGPGKITMRIAVPEGVRVAHSGQNANDRGVFLDKDQKLLVTRIFPDERGGWYMTAVAEPSGATTGTPNELVGGRKGANLTPDQREARIGAPSSMQQPAEPPSQPAQQVNIAGKESVLPGQGPTPTPAKRAARKAAYNQAVANEQNQINNPAPVGAPGPAQAPQPVTPTPAETPPAPAGAPGVPARTEPVHQPIGGVPTEGKSASEVAQTPTPAEAPTPAPAPLAEAPSPATFKQSFQEAGLQSPTAGKQRAQFNNAYLGISSGKKDPADALRELDADTEHWKTLLKRGEAPNPDETRANVAKQEALANHIADHFNLPRAHKEAPQGAPNTATSIPEAKAAGFKSVKELTPEQRTGYDSLDQLGRSRYLARRRAGQEHGAALTGAKGEKAAKTVTPEAAPVKAVKKAAPAKAAPEAAPVKAAGPRIRDAAREKQEREAAQALGVPIRDENGKQRPLAQVRKDVAKATKAAAPEAPAKAAPEKVAKAVPEKAAPTKVAKAAAKAAPAAKAPSEVQTRADEAGLPKTVTALRQAAREKKIKGFSTMNKEQLQRALMGEEVGTGGKVGAIAPDKLTPHIEAASSGQAARALMEEHTVADMKALAKHNGIPLTGLTTKDKLKDAVLTHIRGVEGSGIAPSKPEKSLKEEIQGIKIPDKADQIVKDVNQDDPESLRSARDELDKLAGDAEPVDAGRIRKLSDAMGMRAQVISGQEEAPPTAKKAVKAVKKAAAPKLSVHQERIRKQALADGASEEEARAAAEEAPTRAPAGTKALSKKAAAAAKAAGLPESRAEGAPGPKLTTAKKVAPAGPRPAREGLKLGEGESHQGPQGPREPTPTEKFLATPAKAAKTAVKKAEAAHPDVPKPVVKATRAKVAKAVPDGSVGSKGSTPIDSSERVNEFQKGWNAAKIPVAPDKTSQGSIDEIHREVVTGKITPEEGIRRMESEISLNQDEIDDINRTLRSGQVPEGPEMTKLMEQRDRLITSKAAQEHASTFMHQHFGKERVTPEEVISKLSPENQAFIESMKEPGSGARLRAELAKDPEAAPLGHLEGDTAQEVMQNALKKLIGNKYKGNADASTRKADREIAQEAKKVAADARKAQLEAAKAKRLEEFGPGSAKHLDAKAIAGGDFGRNNQVLADAQAQLDQGKSPKEVAKRVREIGQRMADGNALRHGASPGDDSEAARSMKEKFDQGEVDANKVKAFADRIEAAQRPRAPRATKAQVATAELTEAKKAAKEPAAKKALAKAETAVKESGAEAEALKARIVSRATQDFDAAGDRESAVAAAEKLRSDLLLPELRKYAGSRGVGGANKQEIIDNLIDRRFPSETGPKSRPRPTLEGMTERQKEVLAKLQARPRPPIVESQAAKKAVRKAAPGPAPERMLSPDAEARRLETERADNMARLKAAKALPPAAKFSPDTTAADLAKAGSIEDGKTILARAQTKADLQALANKIGLEHKPGDTKTRLHDNILRRTVTTRLEHGAYVRLGDGPGRTTIEATPTKATPVKKVAKAATPNDLGKGVQTLAQGGFNEPFISSPSTPVKSARARFDENTSAATFGRGADLRAPNGSWSADQGLIHMDSSIGTLWNDLAKDPRTSTPDLNKIAVAGQRLAKGEIDLPTARALIRDIKPGDAAVRERINKAVAELDVKPSKVDVPDNTPKAVRDLLDKLNEIPAYHNKTPNSRGASGPTPFEHILDLVRNIGEGKEGPGGDMKLMNAVSNPHESGDGVYQARRDANMFMPGHQSMTPEIRNWFRSWRNKEQAPEAPKAPEPTKAAPAKAAKAVKKAAPAKVTQAELRTPVAKVGNETPAAPAANVTAKGLTPGDGLPVSNRLAIENKLGQKKTNINALDRAVRSEATRAKVPELLAKVNTELAQAGVGPNDEPRKSLNEWYQKHFG